MVQKRLAPVIAAIGVAAALCTGAPAFAKDKTCHDRDVHALVVHGGAGTWDLSPKEERQYRRAIRSVLDHGQALLARGTPAVETVASVVARLEDSPLFNAGKGSITNNAGDFELDASIMDGKTRNAGAVGAVQTVKNPIHAARVVMDDSPHVLMVSQGARDYVAERGVTIVDPEYFRVDDEQNETDPAHKLGTVGAVATDRCGDVAAGTSTGGYHGKLPGRVGDSPIIGAGTYADNETAGVSATGHGEYFMRTLAAHEVSSLMRYRHDDVHEAARTVIVDRVGQLGGKGGLIALDRAGNVAFPFNTQGMLRGYVKWNGATEIAFH